VTGDRRPVCAALRLTPPPSPCRCAGPFPQSTLAHDRLRARHRSPVHDIFWWAVIVFVIETLLLIALSGSATGGRPSPKPLHGHTASRSVDARTRGILVLVAVPTVRTIFADGGRPPPDGLKSR